MTAMSVIYFPGPQGREEEARHYTDQVVRLVRAGVLAPGRAPKQDRDGLAALVRELDPEARVYSDGSRGATAYCKAENEARLLVRAARKAGLHAHVSGTIVRVRR